MPTNAASSSGLSTGAKAGIGAGVGVAALIAILLGVFFLLRHRKKNRTEEGAHNDSGQATHPGYEAVSSGQMEKKERTPQGVAELPTDRSTQRTAELPAGNVNNVAASPVELDAASYGDNHPKYPR